MNQPSVNVLLGPEMLGAIEPLFRETESSSLIIVSSDNARLTSVVVALSRSLRGNAARIQTYSPGGTSALLKAFNGLFEIAERDSIQQVSGKDNLNILLIDDAHDLDKN